MLCAAPKDIVVNANSHTNDTMPSLAVLADGTTWMAWHGYRNRHDRVLARKPGPGGLGSVHQISN